MFRCAVRGALEDLWFYLYEPCNNGGQVFGAERDNAANTANTALLIKRINKAVVNYHDLHVFLLQSQGVGADYGCNGRNGERANRLHVAADRTG